MKYQVNITGDQPMSNGVKKILEPMFQEMADDFEISTEFIICHGKREFVPEMDFEKFYIFAQMCPEVVKTKLGKLKEVTIGGNKIDIQKGQTDILMIDGDDIPKNANIIKDEAGIAIAVVYDAALYFLSDFCHCTCKEDLDITMTIFKYVINEATKTPELMKALKSGAEEKGKRSLEHVLSKAFKDRLKKENIQMESSAKLYEEYLTNIIKAQRKMLSTEKMIEAIKSNIEAVPDAMEKRWNDTKKLEGSRMYENVSFQRNCVIGTTTPIYCEYDKKMYKFGKFEVILGFDGTVKINSLWSDRGVSYDHPHVSSGNPCWGNMSGELPKRIAESEFDVAFVEIHTFLKSYDRNNPYAKIDKWPVATAKEIEKAKS